MREYPGRAHIKAAISLPTLRIRKFTQALPRGGLDRMLIKPAFHQLVDLHPKLTHQSG